MTISDWAHWADTGCKESPSCLDCPLPKCRFDMQPREYRNLRKQRQYLRVKEVYTDFEYLHGPVMAVRLTAKTMEITERTVYRTLERLRKEN